MTIPLVLGTVLTGHASAVFRRRKPFLLATATVGVTGWLALAALGTPPLWLLDFLFAAVGWAVSGFVAAFSVAKEVNLALSTGIATGVVNAGGFVGAALAQPFVGWLLDRSWAGQVSAGMRVYEPADYLGAQWVSVAIAAVAVVGALLSRETYATHTLPPHGSLRLHT
ncbi:hypothetical protein caldi_04020 [Caldinitratiruptor microaerophilus]|uniref:Major facilitator superfamily (MFS) profile domain-containing protein n=1 Tax=Caldinitratiruptor microaerophilus TaxID=671077 RepID=A0AA35CI17_9FIRM|nr:hypothetical protein caldi_04020 [Caldinitratiruptor microaerophilus]